MKLFSTLPILLLCGLSHTAFSQVYNTQQKQEDPSSVNKVIDLPSNFLSRVDRKINEIENRLVSKTQRYLRKIERQEAKLRRKLYRYDSTAAKQIFDSNTQKQFGLLANMIKNDNRAALGSFTGTYLPYIDSLQGSLAFLNNNTQLLDAQKILPADLQNSLIRLRHLQGKMQYADYIKEFVQQRKQQLQQYLLRYTKLPTGILKTYQGYSKQAYYYAAQIKEYKDVLNDPDKMLRLALIVLNKLPAFTNFMRNNSMLAGLFSNPANYNPSQIVQGLAPRDQVMSAFQTQSGGSGLSTASLVQKNVQSAQGQLDQLRDKLANGNNNEELEMPEFKPNSQKTKSFLKRFEYGTNMQTAQNTNFFPITTDLALSAGYKLNDKNVIGIGASYKVGWGKDIRHIAVSSQGVGFRSFIDIHMKKNFFASGGFEYNYQKPFNSTVIIRDLNDWQQSGLVGLTKIVSLRTKVFKKTRIQLLWDFLSYQQVPRTQPLKFRVGYNF